MHATLLYHVLYQYKIKLYENQKYKNLEKCIREFINEDYKTYLLWYKNVICDNVSCHLLVRRRYFYTRSIRPLEIQITFFSC